MKHWYIAILISFVLCACENTNYRSSVPSVPVNFTLNITQEHPHFVVDNGFQTMEITQSKFEREYIGVAGLLIWIAMDGRYHAADLCCPKCLNIKKPVAADGIFAVCPTCNEQFDLSFGYAFPTKGYAKEPLRSYQAIINQQATGISLRIIN